MWRPIRISLLMLLTAGSLALLNPGAAEAQASVPTREVAPPGREPYHGGLSVELPPTVGHGIEVSVDEPIPAGRRLVIEYVNARVVGQGIAQGAAQGEPGMPFLTIQDSHFRNNQQFERHYTIPLTYMGNNVWLGNHTLRLYHEGGGVSPRFQASRGFGPASGQIFLEVSISGYLIPR
jgi:hypothetical protein